jgi:hypothetical protein
MTTGRSIARTLREAEFGIGLDDVPLEARHRICSILPCAVLLIAVEGLTIIILMLVRLPSGPGFAKPLPQVSTLNSLSVSGPSPSTTPAIPALPLSLPFILIDVITSTAGFTCFEHQHKNFYANDPFIQNGTFALRVVISKQAQVTSNIAPIVQVDCGDGRDDLSCRVDASYANFLTAFPTSPWYFRALDDTFINTTVLYHHLLYLNTVYDPKEAIVFRAHANREGGGRYYIHGGSGWLCSRAFVDTHVRRELSMVKLLKWARYHQDDTAESIIVRAMFPQPELWDEMGISGYACANCGDAAIRQHQWDALPICPDDRTVVQVADLFAIHTATVQEPIIEFIRSIPFATKDVMLARDIDSQRQSICRRGLNTSVWNPKKRNLSFLTAKDVRNPLLDYEKLDDEN